MWRLNANDLRVSFETHNLKNVPHLIILNSPNNPTGYVYSTKEMQEFGHVFNEFHTFVVYDHIYDSIVYNKEDYGDIRDWCTNVISASSLSKNFAAGGYRLGWLAFPPHLNNLWNIAFSLSSYFYTCPSTPLQYVATHALSLNDDIKKYLEFQILMFSNVSKFALQKLKSCNIKCTETQGAYYTLLDFEHYRNKLVALKIHNSDDLCFYLAEKLGLITVSGLAFGICKPFVLRYSIIDIKDIDVAKKSFNFQPVENFLKVLKTWLDSL